MKIYIYENRSKSSKISQKKKRGRAEHFYCGNTQPLLTKLEKLIQILRVSKSSKPHPERRIRAKHVSCGNTQPLLMKLEKLIQISI